MAKETLIGDEDFLNLSGASRACADFRDPTEVSRMIHRLAISAGEPAGIGPDLCVQLAQQLGQKSANKVEYVVVADPDLLQQRAQCLSLPLKIKIFDPAAVAKPNRAGELSVLPLSLAQPCVPGELNPANSVYVLDCLRAAVKGCQNSDFSALVTAPVQKSVINDAGFAFIGHTEFLADLCQQETVVMMLATEGLRVALATTHLPLAAVPKAITQSLLIKIITVLQHELKTKFAISEPHIFVSGLNPHAGEGGHLGDEEINTITPVLQSLRQQGFKLTGPLPADTLFTDKYLQHADAVLAMYHDQGLPVLKYKGFGQAVNITLGLPFIRTSVDHGTALDLAGSGKADIGSLKTAIDYALTMACSSVKL